MHHGDGRLRILMSDEAAQSGCKIPKILHCRLQRRRDVPGELLDLVRVRCKITQRRAGGGALFRFCSAPLLAGEGARALGSSN